MNLKSKTKLAAKALKVSKNKIKFDTTEFESIKEAITTRDIKNLISFGVISKKKINGPSKVRARKIKSQKVKGRRRGQGKRKGTQNARLNQKDVWIIKIRSQRKFLKNLRDKEKISLKVFRDLYRKSKGGFFRSKRHIQLYISENNLVKKG